MDAELENWLDEHALEVFEEMGEEGVALGIVFQDGDEQKYSHCVYESEENREGAYANLIYSINLELLKSRLIKEKEDEENSKHV